MSTFLAPKVQKVAATPSGESSAFDIFQSRQNRDLVRELIAKQILEEYGQKIGQRYDPLMDDVMKTIMESVSEEVPKGVTRENYVVLMNKKLISRMMPTIKANAVKEKPKTMMKKPSGGRMTYMEDPQELLRNRMGQEPIDPQELSRRREVREVFDLPLEDMSQQEPMDIPRNSRSRQNAVSDVDDAYQKLEEERRYRAPPVPPMPKFADEVAEEKNPEASLAMFNQLVRTYDELKQDAEEETPSPKPLPKKKIYLKKMSTLLAPGSRELQRESSTSATASTSMATPIEELRRDEEAQPKVLDLLQNPGPGPGPGPALHSFPARKTRRVLLHLDSKMRNFEYHPDPTSMRIYLSPYFQEEDEYVYLRMKGSYAAQVAIMSSRTIRYPKLNVAPLPTLKGCKEVHLEGIYVDEDAPKVPNTLFLQCGPVEVVEPDAMAVSYSNSHHGILGKHYLQWSPSQNRYQSMGGREEDHRLPVDIDNLQKNGYLRMHLYGMPPGVKDYTAIRQTEAGDNSASLALTLFQIPSHLQTGDILYLYTHGYDRGTETPFMEWEEKVFIEGMEALGEEGDGNFVVRGILVGDGESGEEPLPFKFESHLRGILRQIESHEHMKPDIFYLTIRLAGGKEFLCDIVDFEEGPRGGVICRHPQSAELLEKYGDCVAWGLTKKNLQGGEETLVQVEGVLPEEKKVLVSLLPDPTRLPFKEIPSFAFFIQKKHQLKYVLSLIYEE